MATVVGRVLAGKYQIEELLGRGGMGSVYAARQLALDKRVAVKILSEHVANDEAFVRRFQREAKAASRLDHPSSVRVIDFGQEGKELLYIVMEYLDGRDLGAMLVTDHPLGELRVAQIVAQILSALSVAHELGIVHRDLKPDNIMILPREDDDGRPLDVVKVCDFGIATISASEEGSTLTSQGLILGTPDYMSPEQARGEQLDARTDLYSVGVILYELLTGQPPFRAESALGVALRHVNDPVRPPSQLVPSVDPELEQICMRALEKSRDRRWQSAKQMRAELRAFLEARGSMIPPVRNVRTPVETLADLTRNQEVADSSKRGGLAALAIAAVVVASIALSTTPREVRPEVAPTSATVPVTGTSIAPVVTYAVVETPSPTTPTQKPTVAAIKPKSAVTPLPRREDPYEEPSKPIATVEAPAPQPTVVVMPVAATTTAAPVAKPIDAANAKVSIDNVTATNGLPASSVRAALSHAPLTRCYHDALVGRTAPAKGTAVLRLAIDDTGHVVGATLDGASFLPAVKGCIELAAKTIQVKNVDTGDASATVTLGFAHP